MPLPTPKKDEDGDKFMARCMDHHKSKEEFPNSQQRIAVCIQQSKADMIGRADMAMQYEDAIYDDTLDEFVSMSAQKTFKGKKRSELKDSDFLDSKRRSFPVVSCQDVKDAVSSWGRYTGSMSFDQFKEKLIRRAKKLGCEGSLPKKWEKSSDAKT